jgi:soluble lytic murein transglycosylase-like protein
MEFDDWISTKGQSKGISESDLLATATGTSSVPETPSPLEPDEPDDLISQYSRKYRVPTKLARSLIYQESRGNPKAVGGVGEQGLMQLTPKYFAQPGKDLFDPATNLDIGMSHLSRLIAKYGSVPSALAAYNQGEASFESGKKPKSTDEYVRNIMSRFESSQPSPMRSTSVPMPPDEPRSISAPTDEPQPTLAAATPERTGR